MDIPYLSQSFSLLFDEKEQMEDIEDLGKCLKLLFLDKEGMTEISQNLGLLSQLHPPKEYGIKIDLDHDIDGLLYIIFPPLSMKSAFERVRSNIGPFCNEIIEKINETGGNMIIVKSDLKAGVTLEYLKDLKQ